MRNIPGDLIDLEKELIDVCSQAGIITSKVRFRFGGGPNVSIRIQGNLCRGKDESVVPLENGFEPPRRKVERR